MALIVKDDGQGDYEKAPNGVNAAVICGIHDIGIQSSQYGDKHQCVICFELVGTEGGRVMLSKFYNLSFNEKATLRLHMEGLRGRKYTQEEAANGVDIERLYGVACGVTVTEEEKNNKTRQKITAIAPLPNGMQKLDVTLIDVPEFIRDKQKAALQNQDTPDWEQQSPPPEPQGDMDAPF